MLRGHICLSLVSDFVACEKHPFLLALRRWGRFAGSEERGEMDVFAGY